MKLLKDLMTEETFTMNPKDWGIGGLARTAKHAAHGDKAARPMTTFLQQRNAAEEEESDVQEFHPDATVNDTLRQMYTMSSRSAYILLYKMIKGNALSPMQFYQVMEYYGKR